MEIIVKATLSHCVVGASVTFWQKKLILRPGKKFTKGKLFTFGSEWALTLSLYVSTVHVF